MEWYQIVGLVAGIEIFIHLIFIILTVHEACFKYLWDVYVPMPKDFKHNTDMNWLGCIVCYILLFILLPIPNIGKLIYWLFHV